MNGRAADLPTALAESLDRYLVELNGVPSEGWAGAELAPAVPRAARLATHLRSALDAALCAQPGRARSSLDAALSEVRPEFERLVSSALTRETLGTVYRVRAAPPYQALEPSDMFHIPFELSHLVKPQRYSVPGVPMLYVSASLFTCREEVGSPDPRTLWAAAFRLREGCELRVLNLAFRPALLARMSQEYGVGLRPEEDPVQRLVVDYAAIWPLVIACSYRVRHRDAAFIPEYVLPQLLTSLLAERPEYVGISYFSNRASRVLSPRNGSNFALAARDYAPTGHCAHLAGLLEISKPFSFVDADALGLTRRAMNHVKNDFSIARSSQNQVTYADSVYGQMESVLEEFGWS